MERTTQKHLEALCDRLNKLTNSPMKAYEKDSDGKYVAQIGNFHLDMAYGGVMLVRMQNSGGGVNCPIGQGHTTKRELYEKLSAYIAGIESVKK